MRSDTARAAIAGLVCLLGAARLAAADAPSYSVAAPIDRVTVFPDRAEVVRRLTVELPAGRSRIEVDGLLVELEERTLRCVPAVEDTGLRIVDVVSEVHTPERPQREAEARFAALEEELAAEIRIHEDAIVAAKERARLLGEFRVHLIAGMRRELTAAEPPLADWRRGIGFIAGEAQALAERSRAEEKAIFELKERLAAGRRRLALAAGDAEEKPVRRVRLWLETAAAGPQTIELRYLVRNGVRWGMRYEARLDRERERIGFRAMVAVAQETGEDWIDADLVFSTRQPARGLRPPRLRPLSLIAREAVAEGQAGIGLRRLEVADLDPVEAPPAAAQAEAPPPPPVAEGPDAVPEAKASRLQTGLRIRPVVGDVEELEYVGTEPMTVRADGLPVLVPLGTWEPACTWRYECLPDVLPVVFVRGGFANPAAERFLAGTTEAYLDGTYIGEVAFPDTAADSRIELAFGSVEGLTVNREAKPLTSVTRSGEDGSMREFAYDFTIDLANHIDAAATVRVREAIPTSGVDTVTVTLAEETTPAERLGRGRLQWDVDLPANGTAAIRLRYLIGIEKEFSRGP